jgi:carboxymethylenebutenolidase
MRRATTLLTAMSAFAVIVARGPAVSAERQQEQQQPAYTPPVNDTIPPPDARVAGVLTDSPRHGEWDSIPMKDGTKLNSFVVYPERSDKAGVVIVIHEIFGMTPWVQGVADQLAKDGFIAIAPDLLSGMGPGGGGTDSFGGNVRQAIARLTPADRAARLDAVMAYGRTMPASNGKTGVVGFCWGGGSTLLYAIDQPAIDAAVMYYGPAPTQPGTQTPDLSGLAAIKAPMLAFYGGNDNRVTSTAQPIADRMKQLGKSFEFHVYDGAGHGFMHERSQADYQAAVASWPLAIGFLTDQLR